jgi:hypothetical protein
MERRDQIALSKDEEIAPVDNLSHGRADEPAASRRIRLVTVAGARARAI